MPFLALILVALAAGATAGLIVWRYPRLPGPAVPSVDAAREVGEAVGEHRRLRSAARRRLDPKSSTGLLLTLALLFTIGAGVLLAVLAVLVRTNSHLTGIDRGAAGWGHRHASSLSTHGLTAVTQLGSILVVVVLAVLLAAIELRRAPSVWLVPFIVAVVGGEELTTNVIKPLVDRVRPDLNPAAAGLGPSFPSGHSATAAAFYACAVLLLGRRRSRGARAVLTGAGVGIAVAVASSRVLLDVHWVTDVIAGLALGWAWFAICSMAFGGRILDFGAAVRVAERAAATESSDRRGTKAAA